MMMRAMKTPDTMVVILLLTKLPMSFLPLVRIQSGNKEEGEEQAQGDLAVHEDLQRRYPR